MKPVVSESVRLPTQSNPSDQTTCKLQIGVQQWFHSCRMYARIRRRYAVNIFCSMVSWINMFTHVMTSWMTSQRIFNINNTAKDINSISSPHPDLSLAYVYKNETIVEHQFTQIMFTDWMVHVFLRHSVDIRRTLGMVNWSQQQTSDFNFFAYSW